MRQVKEGDRVTLRADEDEGWPEQVAIVVGVQHKPTGDVIVTVEVDDREDDRDDGLREVGIDQVL